MNLKPETVGFIRGGMLFLEPPAKWRSWQRDVWTCCGSRQQDVWTCRKCHGSFRYPGRPNLCFRCHGRELFQIPPAIAQLSDCQRPDQGEQR